MLLDDTRGGLDASSLRRATSMDKYMAKKLGLLSMHRVTSSIASSEAKKEAEKLSSQLNFLNLVPKVNNYRTFIFLKPF